MILRTAKGTATARSASPGRTQFVVDSERMWHGVFTRAPARCA
jgi:hypothetical protein